MKNPCMIHDILLLMYKCDHMYEKSTKTIKHCIRNISWQKKLYMTFERQNLIIAPAKSSKEMWKVIRYVKK